MTCAERLRTQAFIDGQIAGAEADAVERHIEGCADCQAFCSEAAAMSDGIRTLLPRHTAPAHLRRNVEAAIEAERVRTAALERPERRGGGEVEAGEHAA